MAKKSATDIKRADVHQDEEMHVTRTTPQGTQEAGVEKGHELRDIKIRELLYWFAGLVVYIVASIGGMWLLVLFLTSTDRVEKTRVSTPLYGKDVPQRMPELLPNPQQLTNGKGYTLPWDHYRDFVRDESVKLKDTGLEDEFGRPAMPASVATELQSAPSGDGAPGDELRPSDATGGTGPEIAILTK